jgi:hypothetical protein
MMLMKFNGGLGMIPSWQFSMDPNVNPKINPHVTYPDGIYQTTPQPIGPYYQGPELSGIVGSGGRRVADVPLGAWVITNQNAFWAGIKQQIDEILLTQKRKDEAAQYRPQSGSGSGSGSGAMHGVAGPRVLISDPALGFSNPFDSWWWTNRKWVALGVFGVLGAAAIAGATAILR